MVVKTAALRAREYQKQLFAKAINGNVIACVETGSGKTLVAALLLEHMYSLEVASPALFPQSKTRRRVSLFLVNLVPLVHQQAAFLDANTSLKVVLLYGDLDVDTRRRDYWDSILASQTGVVVCTARIALNSIIHAYLSLEDVNLIVFDEAHHAIGNNEYARIMSYYRLVRPEKRPKIFGMTASPLSSRSTVKSASTELEQVLQASIFTVSSSVKDELASFVNRPMELVVQYRSHRDWKPIQPMSSSMEAEIVNQMDSSTELTKILDKMAWYRETHGAVFSDLAWLASRREFRSRASRKAFHVEQLKAENLVSPELMKSLQKFQDKARISHKIAELVAKLEYPDTIELSEANSSPKLRKLVDTLACFKSQSDVFCGIIFCERRLTALALQLLIEKTPCLSFLHCEALVGHGGSTHAPDTDIMSWETQCEILSRLRRRDPTNLVIATSVLEEGLDIMPVNCVIRFDLPNHHIGYVQSRGRARSSHSTFILFAEEDNYDHAELIIRIESAEKQMRDWLDSLPDDRLAALEQDEEEGVLLLDDSSDLMRQSHCDERTGARIWPVDATALLSHYVSLLKTDEFCLDGPVYELEGYELAWRVTVRLPASSRLSCHTGPLVRSKAAAKALAAYETCVCLHEMGELNEHLAPHKKVKLFKDRTEALVADLSGIGEAVDGGSQNTLAFLPAIPSAFRLPAIPCDTSSVRELYLHVINFPDVNVLGRSMDPIALVTAKPILQQGMCNVVLTEYRARKDVVCPPLTAPLPVMLGAKELQRAISYTLMLLSLLAGRNYEFEAMPYLLLPLEKATMRHAPSIDWTSIEQALTTPSGTRKVTSNCLSDLKICWQDALLLDRPLAAGRARPYRFVGMDPSQGPYSRVRNQHLPEQEEQTNRSSDGDSGGDVTAPIGTSYWEEYQSSHLSRGVTTFAPRSDQPMLIARRLPRRLENFLTVTTKKDRVDRGRDSYLIPEFIWLHSIRAGLYESALLLPSLLARLSQIMIARDLNASVFGGRLDTSQLVVALTGPTAQHPFHYQRLEYLGDALLKCHVSAYVFAISDTRVEGQNHMHRREIISNVNLLDKSKHLELGTMLYTRCFTRKGWAPPHCRIKDRAADRKDSLQRVSPKMLADLVESVIGAAVMTTDRTLTPASRVSYVGTSLWMNIDLGLQTVVDFGLLPPEFNTFEKINRAWTDQVWPKRIAKQWDQRLHAGALHNLETHIGYQFKSPHLALESMTHPSLHASVLPSYQRLEFLGDALLELVVNCWLFQKYPDINEGQLTTLKGMAVCNQTLCALGIHLKLHKFLQMGQQTSFSSALAILTIDLAIAKKAADEWIDRNEASEMECGEAVRQASSLQPPTSPSADPVEQIDDADSGDTPLFHYWTHVSEMKTVADLVESLLGAVFVDSGFSVKTTWDFFARFYLPWFERYCHYEACLQKRRRNDMKGRGQETSSSSVLGGAKLSKKQICVNELRADEGTRVEMDEEETGNEPKQATK